MNLSILLLHINLLWFPKADITWHGYILYRLYIFIEADLGT